MGLIRNASTKSVDFGWNVSMTLWHYADAEPSTFWFFVRYDSLSYVRSTSYSMVSCSQAAEDRSAMALQMLFTLCSTRELESGYAANIH